MLLTELAIDEENVSIYKIRPTIYRADLITCPTLKDFKCFVTKETDQKEIFVLAENENEIKSLIQKTIVLNLFDFAKS